MNQTMPTGACWCPRCNQPGNPDGEDDHTPALAAAVDPWTEAVA